MGGVREPVMWVYGVVVGGVGVVTGVKSMNLDAKEEEMKEGEKASKGEREEERRGKCPVVMWGRGGRGGYRRAFGNEKEEPGK